MSVPGTTSLRGRVGGNAVRLQRRRRGLTPGQVFLMAWRNLSGNMLRSVLTALGIIIGVAAVVALTAVGAGVNAQV
jgi:putative ABC transport system permease protein